MDVQSSGVAPMLEPLLPEIDRVISWVSRRRGFSRDESEEFRSVVLLRLLEDDCAVLRRFDGRSLRSTYLTSVIMHQAHDFRVRKWGRWRPSAAAQRSGTAAVELETLVCRDGFTLDEAIAVIESRGRSRATKSELREIFARLPPRTPRRIEGEEALAGQAAPESAEDNLREGERAKARAELRALLAELLAAFGAEDRRLFRMRFVDGLQIATIAKLLGLEQRPLYPRIKRLLAGLKADFKDRGVGKDDVLDSLESYDDDPEVDYDAALGEDSVEPSVPSDERDADDR